jgi:hypothetical protein
MLNRPWDDNVNSGNWLFKVVPIFIAVVFILIVAYYLVIATVGIKLVGEVDKKGLKSVVERVWNGPVSK